MSRTGLPADTPADFVQHLFWSLVIAVGGIWRRLVKPYRRFPFCLALLVDPHTSTEHKTQLAKFFLNLSPCCLDVSYTGPLRQHVNSVEDLLSDNSIGQHILKGSFSSKNHNIAVETSFGRAASMRQTNRGRTDRSHNMCSKHLLAEISYAHKRARVHQKQQEHHVVNVANHPALQDEDEPHSSHGFSTQYDNIFAYV